MMLSYNTTFPWGDETKFKGKICMGYTSGNSNDDFEKLTPEDYPNGSIYDGVKNRKIHTIREDLKQRWRPGMKIEHVIFPYRKGGRDTFLRNTCTWVQSILIKYLPVCGEGSINAQTGAYLPRVIVDGRVITPEKIDELARNDGFDSTDQFFCYFDKDFSGRIIHWTNTRY
jgi:hypothetical protein